MTKNDIDVLDFKLLKLLDEDPTMSITKLASLSRVSVQSAEYRIHRLISIGAIDKFCTIINIFGTGYRLFRLCFLLKSANEQKKDEFREHLINNKNTMWVAHVGGDWDILTDIYTKSLSELSMMLEEITTRFESIIFGFEIMEIMQFYETNYKDINSKKTRIYSVMPVKKTNLKKNDMKILASIKNNCRKSVLSISKECGISYNTVNESIRRMEEQGIIVGYRLLLNPLVRKKQMYKVFVQISNPRKSNIDKITSFCSSNEHVYDVVNLLGKYQVDFEVAIADFSELQEIILFLREKFEFVKDIKFVPIFKNMKLDHFPQES